MRSLLLPLTLAALLGRPAAADTATDPWERVNRQVHAFNAAARSHALSPLAKLWRSHVPPGARAGIGLAVGNLGEPLTALSGLAAGEMGLAGHALARFGINTTLGLGGWRDAAAERGWEVRRMTPGDAACAWGIPSGPFLMLPLLGPSTLRDAAAGLAGNAALAQGLGTLPVAGLQAGEAFLGYERVEPALQRLEAEALDPYAVLRSAWLQRRAAACPQDALAEEARAPEE